MTAKAAHNAGPLNDQVAIVTGAAQGLGRGIATRLAEDGARVVLADISDAIHAVAAGIGPGVTAHVCDVADSAAVDRLVAAAVEQHGYLDAMVANAGVGGRANRRDDRRGPPPHPGRQPGGTFYCCRAAARVMIPRQSGSIVTVGSIFGRDTPARSAAYGASKAGIVALTQAAPESLGHTAFG